MQDQEILSRINELVEEEHHLLKMEESGELTDPDNKRMKELEVALDQCWDLLRQRRARREFGQNPDEAHVRPAEIVENYKQ
jgi:hypothetical protein